MDMQPPVVTMFRGRSFVLFFNPNEDNGCLSNWYEAPFSLDGREFANVEQAFVYLKAMHFGDEATANRVFAMSDPLYLQRINKQVTPYDRREWLAVRESVMRRCVGEKVAQVEGLAEFLLSTGDATIAACSARDRYWGNGCDPMSLSRLVPEEWPGKNVLGSILEDLHASLRAAGRGPKAPVPAETAAGTEPAPEPAPVAPEAPAPAEPAPEAEPAEMPSSEAPDGAREPAPETTVGAANPDADAARANEAPIGTPTGAPAGATAGADGETTSPEGTLLKRLVVRYLGNLTADNLDRLVSALSVATVTVPVTPVDGDAAGQDGAPDPEARFAFERDGRHVRPNVLENERHQRWFAVFTGADEVPGAASGEQETVELPMTECVEMARTRGDVLGVIVNAFTDCLTLTPETCLRVAEVARRGRERPLEA
jgi:ribA/ribD-fused uncharacterized protein